jgi:radical SAM superfamily enzyme YgiQ (UPF0313 family)
MRVLLVSANTEQVNMPTLPLGASLVAAAARRAGHEVTFLDLMFESQVRGAIRRAVEQARPEVIGISVRNIDDQHRESPRFLLRQIRRVVEECRTCSEAPVVLGGAGYSIFPDAVLAYLGADLGVAGDGEVVFPELLQRLEHDEDPSDLPGVHLSCREPRTPPHRPRDLDAFPLPADELWAATDPTRKDLWVPVQSRRGCPNDCSYCSTASIQGRPIRTRSPAQVVEHIARAASAGFHRFYFVDNSFNIPEPHALELCRLLAALPQRVSWRCILYPQNVKQELVGAMARAGCVEVALGFESGSPKILQEMNKRFTPEEVAELAKLLGDHGIRRIGFLLLGGPGETQETVEQSLAFADALELDGLRTTVGIRIYPDTPLARRALQEGLIDPNNDLLFPRFYLARGLEPWIHQRVTPGFRGR